MSKLAPGSLAEYGSSEASDPSPASFGGAFLSRLSCFGAYAVGTIIWLKSS
jgi:hypothetical protein